MYKTRSLLLSLLANMIILGASFFVFNSIPLQSLFPCSYPLSKSLLLALFAAMLIHVFGITKIWPSTYRPALLTFTALIFITFWFGSYPLSLLGFSTGRVSVLRGFMISRPTREPTVISSGELVSLAGESTAEIEPMTLAENADCFWSSSNGGAFDDPRSCDVAYRSPGGVSYDVLRILLRPGCQLPSTHGEIRVDILP